MEPRVSVLTQLRALLADWTPRATDRRRRSDAEPVAMARSHEQWEDVARRPEDIAADVMNRLHSRLLAIRDAEYMAASRHEKRAMRATACESAGYQVSRRL